MSEQGRHLSPESQRVVDVLRDRMVELRRQRDDLLEAARNALDRGYFDPHPDDSEQEADEKRQARATIAKAEERE